MRYYYIVESSVELSAKHSFCEFPGTHCIGTKGILGLIMLCILGSFFCSLSV